MRLFLLALRNLSRNRRRTVLSLLAILVGVGAMVTFRGVIHGLRQLFYDGLVYGQSGALQVHRAGYTENLQGLPLTLDLEDSPELRRRMSEVPGVTAVSPRINFGAMLTTPDKPTAEGQEPEETGRSTFFIVTAVEPATEWKVTPRRLDYVGKGRLFETADAPELVLNADLQQSLDAPVHPDPRARPPAEQWMAVLSNDRDGALNGANVVISGTLVSATAGDRKTGLMPLATAQQMLRMEGRVTEYGVDVARLEEASAVRDRLVALLGPGYEVHTWDQLMPFLPQMIATQDAMLGMVSTVFLVIVLLGIVNSMLMSVLERVREIGTMLAVGMRRRQVVRMFLFEGILLGVTGGVLGALLGWVLVVYLNQRGISMKLPGASYEGMLRPFVSMRVLAGATAAAVVGSALAALWPAWRASRYQPVDALRSA